MLQADAEYFAAHGEPLFSSHMLDLSEEPKDENIHHCAEYFAKMAKYNIWLEMEIGITGGEEDGVDNIGVDNSSLYTQPEDIYDVYKALNAISPNFSIAAAFGNVHGVYKPGNVRLHPELLQKHQEYAAGQLGGKDQKPLFLVFHGGSGSSKDEIHTAVQNGVVKMNVDTDTQFAYLAGIRDFVQNKSGYLQSQVGNPEGQDKPNKKVRTNNPFSSLMLTANGNSTTTHASGCARARRRLLSALRRHARTLATKVRIASLVTSSIHADLVLLDRL